METNREGGSENEGGREGRDAVDTLKGVTVLGWTEHKAHDRQRETLVQRSGRQQRHQGVTGCTAFLQNACVEALTPEVAVIWRRGL